MANHVLKSVIMLSIFSSVMVVISTVTEIIVAKTTQRQTQQDVLAGQAVIKQNPFVTLNEFRMLYFIRNSGGRVKSFTWLKLVWT